jgi:hypothetical protein
VLVLIPLVGAALLKPIEARSLAWLLQIMPVAFVYRIRANQEHPVLMGFLALLYSTHRARSHAGWMAVMAVSFGFLVLIKAAFAMFALVAAALWLLMVPVPSGGSNLRAWIGLAVTVAAAALLVVGYEALYVRTTGESFLAFYNSTRVGGSIRLTDPAVIPHALVNVGWYIARLLWFAAPWSLCACVAVWAWLRWRTAGVGGPFDPSSERGLIWALAVTAVYIAVLSPALVRAERFIFPAYFVIGAVGVAMASRNAASMHRVVARAAHHPWLPIAVWFGTFLLSLGSKLIRL